MYTLVLLLLFAVGGDLMKYSIKGIRGYVGADIAVESLKQAIDRYNSTKLKVFTIYSLSLPPLLIFDPGLCTD